MTKPKAKSLVKVVKTPKILSESAKIRKKPQYKSFRLHKTVKHPSPALPSWRAITVKALRLLKANRRNVLAFSIFYGLFFILFVRGVINPVDVTKVKDDLIASSSAEPTTLALNAVVFSQYISTIGNSVSGSQGVYQLILLTVSSLALIWLFRQQQAGNYVRFKDALYRGMYPLIPFLLVFYYMVLQIMPAIIGNFLFSTVIKNGLAVGAVEQIIWVLFFATMVLLSCYWISSTFIALFIVTLPDMTPKLAIKKARELVQFRRFSVFVKTTAIIVLSLLIFALTVLPSLFISTLAAHIIFLLLSILIVPFVVAYLFVLYRELL